MRKAALLLAAASLAAIPGAAHARVFFGVGVGLGPVFVAPPPVYYAPPPYYYAPPPYVAYAPPPAFTPGPYAPIPGMTCATVRFSCPMRQAGILGGSCTCPTVGGALASGLIR